MNNKILPILIVFLLGLTAAVFAQTPTVVVEYYENSSGEMYVRTPDGAEYEVDQFGFGEELPVGATIITLDGDYAELRMDPNGTIIRVGENTNFRVDGLQGRGDAQQNTFSVAVGKFKAVVAKQDGARYTFRSSTAVMGVRGTTLIGSSIPGVEEIAYVIDGVVDYTNAAGQTLVLGTGQAANALAANFVAFQPSADLLQNLQRGMDFVRLRIDEVPGYIEEVIEEAVEEEAVPEEEEAVVEEEEGEPVAEVTEAPGKEPEAKPEPETPEWLVKAMNFLGLELGTATMYDYETGEPATWAKAIIQPKFALGKLKVALYLPIIYQEDMFNPKDWYRPEENNEWSFGVDKLDDGWDEVALDALNDLFLKIRYIEWGDNRDPFFFKLGNIANFSPGHGSIMRNYANDSNFPTERKIGLNLGVNKEKGGLELMVNDAADPEIFGFRIHARPFAPGAKLGFGFTALADINPERLEFGEAAMLGNPIFLNAGLDLDQPIIERDALSLILFADVTSMIPYFREDVGSISSGFGWDAVWPDGNPLDWKNWGLDAGIFGKLLILDYRLEFLYSDGIAQTPFYGPQYDLQSPTKVVELVNYLQNPTNPLYDVQRMGVYGELGYTLDKVFYITGGYNWNWPIDKAGEDWPADRLKLEFGLFKDLLPVYGSIGLIREGLATVFINDSSMTLRTFFSKETGPAEHRFFDENLILSGELVYPISPILELAVEVKSNVIGGEWYPSWSILTRLNG
ncbi:MAG: FecR domain-containing protein [Spirochaetaceae bacterium]|nr:MAG: FecR domain-containing protein [Spirochaetaceae bacterium]